MNIKIKVLPIPNQFEKPFSHQHNDIQKDYELHNIQVRFYLPIYLLIGQLEGFFTRISSIACSGVLDLTIKPKQYDFHGDMIVYGERQFGKLEEIFQNIDAIAHILCYGFLDVYNITLNFKQSINLGNATKC